MLKTRVMPTLLYKNHGLVKGVGFNSWRPFGAVLQSIQVYGMREVDELVFLDITATPEQREPDYHLIDDIADYCFMPLTVGGGISSVEHVRKLLRVGADKIAVNTAAIQRPALVAEIADRFGSQCVVASIDVLRHADGSLEVHTHAGKQPTGRHPVDVAHDMEKHGAGEILLTSIDRDGSLQGYDIELTRQVADAVSIPVIASGGAGLPAHMVEVMRDGGASAVAAAAIYHFTQTTPRDVKRALGEAGFPVRL